MPDALPALSVMACAAQGETRFVNVAQARIKETDRIAVMHEELLKMGADIEELPDGLIVRHSRLKGAVVNGHNDHRVVMALAIAAMIADGETVIETAEAANVTYTDFVNDFRSIGADITIIN
jgi:3-phosphoshikimate 1-carboxyvinyltransferase